MASTTIDLIADKVTTWIGSTASLVVHTILFAFTFSSHWLFGWEYSFILLVLTTVVSLEAIYISIFIQRAVNQQAIRLTDVEQTLDEVEESIDEVEESLDGVEETLDDVEEALDDVGETLDSVEEDLKEDQKEDDEDRGELKQLEESNELLLVEVRKLVKELRAAKKASEKE